MSEAVKGLRPVRVYEKKFDPLLRQMKLNIVEDGLFHQFGVITSHGETYPCAIVELEHGQLKSVDVELIRFLDRGQGDE